MSNEIAKEIISLAQGDDKVEFQRVKNEIMSRGLSFNQQDEVHVVEDQYNDNNDDKMNKSELI